VVTGGVYTELGASAFDLVDGTTTVVITGSVDVNATGTYTVTYSSTDAALNIGTATRTVNVVDVITPDVDAPVITVTGSSTISIVVGGVYTELGAVALDVVDGSFAATSTGTVDTATIGTYAITYGATDAAGNVATEVTRTVNVVAAPVVDTTAPVITINGSSTVALLVGDTYTELGATVTDDTDATTTATVVGNVDTTTVGTYTITYTATDLAGNVGTPLTRTVVVSNPVVVVPDVTAPVVTLNGGSVVQVVTGGVYTELGASAFDLVDGTTTVVITGSVDVNATGTYTVTYSSTDAALNIGTATRTVNVVDVITPDVDAPVITVTGSSTISIVVGGVYTELGAVALDVVDGSFAATSTGTVDTATIGTYAITYGATDAAGNVATEVTRTVNVVAAPVVDTTAPVITINGSSTVALLVGDTYTELGATVTDDTDATTTATVVGNVDTTTVGTYTSPTQQLI
jgi:hypothetical protein